MRIRLGTVLYLLGSALLLLALYYASRQPQPPLPAQTDSAPVMTTPVMTTPAPQPAAVVPKAPVTAPDLDLALPQQTESTAPAKPFRPAGQTESHTELFDILSHPAKDRSPYSISGKLILEEHPDFSLKSVDGAQLELHIKTD